MRTASDTTPLSASERHLHRILPTRRDERSDPMRDRALLGCKGELLAPLHTWSRHDVVNRGLAA